MEQVRSVAANKRVSSCPLQLSATTYLELINENSDRVQLLVLIHLWQQVSRRAPVCVQEGSNETADCLIGREGRTAL